MIFGYVTAFAPSYEIFALSRLLVGLMNGGIGLVCFVLAQEYVGKSYWAMTGTKKNTETILSGVILYDFAFHCSQIGLKIMSRGIKQREDLPPSSFMSL